MELIGKKIGDIHSKYHTINGQKLRGCFLDSDDNHGQVVFLDNETPVYKAGVWHTTDHHWMQKQNETITSLIYDLEEA